MLEAQAESASDSFNLINPRISFVEDDSAAVLNMLNRFENGRSPDDPRQTRTNTLYEPTVGRQDRARPFANDNSTVNKPSLEPHVHHLRGPIGHRWIRIKTTVSAAEAKALNLLAYAILHRLSVDLFRSV
jgi:hypothetical protein